MQDLTIIYYTSNHLEETNPYFLNNTKKALIKAVGDLPIISISHKPVELDYDNHENYLFEAKERSHLNIYRQILEGAKRAKTKYVAMAEDDILYSYEHFHSKLPPEGVFLYDMNKLSLFTWTKPPLFSFRHNRKVVNQLIAPRDYLVEAMEERFKRVDELLAEGRPLNSILKYFGDPGRYEGHLGVTKRRTDTFMCTCPSIVFTHEHAFGYLNHGNKKRLGDLRVIEVPYWGRAEEVLKQFYKE